MKVTFSNSLLVLLMLTSLFACKDSGSKDATLDLMEINSATVDGYSVKLSALKPLATGYNQLFWLVSKDNQLIGVDSMNIMPIMDMMTMSHSCPTQKPFKSVQADGYFEGYVVFIMPSGEMGSWSITATLWLSNGEQIETTLNISVLNSWKLQSFTHNNVKYFVSWVSPQEPFVGKNTVELMLHKKATMMSFPESTDLMLELYPYMNMGGGEGHSAPYEQLKHVGNGKHTGSISFSMSGEWQISVFAKHNADTAATVVFTINVISK